MRNPEFGIASLEKWAEMLQILKDIAGNRMPSVADLLKAGAPRPRAWPWPLAATNNGRKMAGQSPGGRLRRRRPKPKAGDKPKPPSAIPTIADRESSQQPPDEKAGQAKRQEPAARRPGSRFPVTTLAGKAEPKPSRRRSARRRKGRRGRRQAARPAGRVREDRRRAQPRARQPRREHAGEAAQGRLAAPVQDRRPDQRPGERGLRRGRPSGRRPSRPRSWARCPSKRPRPATTSR